MQTGECLLHIRMLTINYEFGKILKYLRSACLTWITWIRCITCITCNTCTTEISHQLISWDIIDTAGIIVHITNDKHMFDFCYVREAHNIFFQYYRFINKLKPPLWGFPTERIFVNLNADSVCIVYKSAPRWTLVPKTFQSFYFISFFRWLRQIQILPQFWAKITFCQVFRHISLNCFHSKIKYDHNEYQ